MHSKQIIKHSTDDKTVLRSCQKLGGAAKCLIDHSKKGVGPLSVEFRVRMLLKGAAIKYFLCACSLLNLKYDIVYILQYMKKIDVVATAFDCLTR